MAGQGQRQQPKTRNRKRQTRDEQLGKGKDSQPKTRNRKRQTRDAGWARAKTAAKDKKQFRQTSLNSSLSRDESGQGQRQ